MHSSPLIVVPSKTGNPRKKKLLGQGVRITYVSREVLRALVLLSGKVDVDDLVADTHLLEAHQRHAPSHQS